MERRKIKITCVINPNKFYFKYAETNTSNLLDVLESDIKKSLEEKRNNSISRILEGEIYAFHNKKWGRWVRVCVKKSIVQNNRPQIILWLIDYGFSYKTDQVERLSTLDNEFKTELNLIYCGCIDVLPAKSYFNLAVNKTKLTFSHEWSQAAIDFMNNFIDNGKHLRFHKYGSKGNVDIGEITVTDNFELTYNLKKMLIAQKFAIGCPASKLVESLKYVDMSESLNCKRKDQNYQNMPSVLNKNNKFDATPDYLMTCAGFNFEKFYKNLTNNNKNPETIEGSSEIKAPNKELKGQLKSTNNHSNVTFIPAGICIQDYIVEDKKQEKKSKTPPTTVMPQKDVSNFETVAIKFLPVIIKPQSFQNPPIEQQSQVIKQQIPKIIARREVREDERDLKEINSDKAIVCASDVHRVLVHGNFLSNPIDKLEEGNFSKTIFNSMKEINYRVFRIQAYTWRHILDGRSMVIVNIEKSGQTFSYLPAILNTVADDCEDITFTPLCGPSCIIIVRSSRDVENIYNTSKKLLTSNSPVKILKGCGNNDESTVVQLLNGCDIFITTPPIFYRLTNNSYVKLFDVKRIKYLIFDGLDSMLKLWQSNIQLIIKTCTKGTKCPEENPQIIVTSNVWHHQIKKLMSLSCQPVVCIGNYIEAAVYAGSKFALKKCVSIEEKALELCSRLKDESYMYRRTMVIVNNQAEIVQLVMYLKSLSIIFSIVDENSSREDIASKNSSWGCQVTGKFSLMVVIDTMVPQITFNSVQYLYHFSLPSTWTMFSYRFTVSYDYYLKYLDSINGVNENTMSELLPYTTILLDDENLNEIPRLIDFMLVHRLAEIPRDILNFVEKICYEREREKRDSKSGSFLTLCPNIFQFGECAKKISCSFRHIFIFEDRAISHLPYTGQIKFQLVDTLNPTMFKIKILEHKLSDNSSTWISRKKELEYGEECMELMQTFYAVKENHIMKHPVKVNDLCAVFDNKDVNWYRCIVKEKKQECMNYFFARVLLIDIGRTINVKSTDLLMLHVKFQQFAPQVTDLQVLNIIPNDFEDYWQQEITNSLKSKLAKEPKNSYCVCQIQLAIQNTLFTENFEIKHELPGLGIDLSDYDLTSDLINKKQCSIDPLIMKKLKTLATACNLVVPEIPKVIPLNVPPKSIKPEPKIIEEWKQLHWNTDYEVIIKDFNNPEDFFVIVSDPKKKIQEIGDFEAKDNLKDIVVSVVCLARRNNGPMKRVKIMKQIDDEYLIECFLLDFGETLRYHEDELYEIPSHLVEFLPFQAIHCRLIGICPLHEMDTWTKASINTIYKMLKSSAEILKMVVFKNNEKHLKNKLLQINSYDVMLFDSESGQRFDELLIKMDFAVSDEVASKLVIKDQTEELWSDGDEDFVKNINNVETDLKSNDFLQTFNLEDIDCQIEEDEIMTMMGFPGAKVIVEEKGEMLYPFQKVNFKETIPKLPKVVENVKVNEIKENTFDLVETQQQLKNIPSLSCSMKHPKIEWRQTNVLIYLKISAIDCINYSLKINPQSMSIILKYEDCLESAIVHFFGCLDASLSSHELCGLNITVRLAKRIVGKTWLRLTQHPEKNHAIKYSTEEINLLTEEKIITGIVTNKTMYRPDDSDYEDYSSDSSHDDIEFNEKLLEEPFT